MGNVSLICDLIYFEKDNCTSIVLIEIGFLIRFREIALKQQIKLYLQGIVNIFFPMNAPSREIEGSINHNFISRLKRIKLKKKYLLQLGYQIVDLFPQVLTVTAIIKVVLMPTPNFDQIVFQQDMMKVIMSPEFMYLFIPELQLNNQPQRSRFFRSFEKMSITIFESRFAYIVLS